MGEVLRLMVREVSAVQCRAIWYSALECIALECIALLKDKNEIECSEVMK